MASYPAIQPLASVLQQLSLGSQDTLKQMPARFHDKSHFIPEKAVSEQLFFQQVLGEATVPLRAAFVGRLVPYKGADMLLEATADSVRSGKVIVDIIGDGPMMPQLRALAGRLGMIDGVTLNGWVPHEELQDRLVQADVLGFPSIRKFGGGVVLEAMALGLVPIVVDYGGPGELVMPETGFEVPMGSRQAIIRRFGQVLSHLAENTDQVRPTGARARAAVLRKFTWEAKAERILSVYERVLGVDGKAIAS